MTWGWTDSNSKHTPAFNFKTAGQKPIKPKLNGGLLLVEVCLLHRTQTFDQYPKFKIYQEQQFQFVKSLPEHIHNKLIVRLNAEYKKQFWCEDQRWHDFSPSTRLDDGTVKISELISGSRIVVHSYDGTTMLETLSQDIPTLCFWYGGLSSVRESAQPYYEKLMRAGIIHDSPEYCAKKVVEVWDDASSWWQSDSVQSARKLFCERYARVEPKPIDRLKSLLLS